MELVNDETSSLDYALIAVEKIAHMVPNKLPNNHYPQHRITCVRLAPLYSCDGMVLALTSHGAIPGSLRRTPAYVLTPGSRSYCAACYAKFSAPLEVGDSGSWVVDAQSGDVYGHIVAGSPQKGLVIVIPFSAIFANIEASMGFSPQFPTDHHSANTNRHHLPSKESDSIRTKLKHLQGLGQIGPSHLKFPVAKSVQHDSGIHITDVPASASLRHNMKNVDKRSKKQASTSFRCELPCEFPGCAVVFHGHEDSEWMAHTLTHFGGTLPSQLLCWFKCDSAKFDTKSTQMGGDPRYNFECRMRHIRDHILNEDYQPRDRVPDAILIAHLREKRIIDEQTYRDWLRPSAPPSISGERSVDNQVPRAGKQAFALAPLTKARSTGEVFEYQSAPQWDWSTF